MALKRIQSTFTGGIHTSSLNSAIHLEQYYTGLKDAKNVMITPQGSIKRRMGTNLLQTLEGNDTQFNLVEFSVKDDLKLILIFGNNNLHVFTQNGLVELEYSSAGLFSGLKYSTYRFYGNFVLDTFGDIDPNTLDFAQSLNSLIITHKNTRPQLLTCENIETENQALNSILIKDLEFRKKPYFDFQDDLSPINQDFQAKFSISRADSQTGNSEFAKNRFRLSLDGNITKYIDFGQYKRQYNDSGTRFLFNHQLYTQMKLNYTIGDKIDIRFIDRKSRYKFKINQKILSSENTESNCFDNFEGFGDLIYNGNEDFDEFLKWLSDELNIMFFYEVYGVVLKRSVLNNTARANLPLSLTLRNQSEATFNDMKVFLFLRSETHFTIKEEVTYRTLGTSETPSQTVTEEQDFIFSAIGDFYFEGNIVEQVVICPSLHVPLNELFPDNEKYREIRIGSEIDSSYNKTAPYDIIFKVKKEIEELNIMSDMKNVYVNNGVYGLFGPFGGGNCALGSSPNMDFPRNGYSVLGISLNGSSRTQSLITLLRNNNLYSGFQNLIEGKFYNPNEQNAETGLLSINIKITGKDAKDYSFNVNVGDGNESITEVDLPLLGHTSGGEIKEDVWSDIRGWPSKCLFIENRLVFANTKLLPNAMWFSEQDNFFSFKEGGDPQDAINNLRPTQTTLNQINHLTGNKSLQVFTSGSEHYNPNQIDAANISLPQQSNFGTYEEIKPVFIDNATFYFDRNRNLRQFIYDDLEVSYKSENASILCPELINQTSNKVVKMRAARIEDSNYVFLIREDGSIVCYQTIREQNIRNFVVWDSPDVRFNDIVELDGKVFGIAKFDNNFHIIEFNKEALSDLENNFSFQPNVIEEGQYYLFPVKIVEFYEGYKSILRRRTSNVNDYVFLNEEIPRDLNGITTIENYNGGVALTPVTGDGQSNTSREDIYLNYYKDLGNDRFNQIGLYFESYIETKDIAYDVGRGQELVGKKKFNRSWVSLRESAGWYLQKNNFVYKPRGYIGESNFDFSQRFNNFTDDTEIRLTGYHNRINIKLTQAVPSYGELQALTLEIKV